jgi:cytidylate kinase
MKGIVAIDGPAGSGKSTAARGLAERLGYIHLDSGALYRCVAYAVIGHEIQLDEHKRIGEMAARLRIEFLRDGSGKPQVFLNGLDRTVEIREETVTRTVPMVAQIREVRALVDEQLRGYAHEGGVVCDGRDIGTNVFPSAQAKFYLDADLEERARRCKQSEYALLERDRQDRERAHSPLKPAKDAIKVDTTKLSAVDTLNILYDKTLPLLSR